MSISAMAEEYNTNGNWWDSSRSNFESSGTLPSNSSTLSINSGLSFVWPTDDHQAPRSSMESMSVPTTSSLVFQDTQKLQSSSHGDPNLHFTGLGLSSQNIDQWNQSLLRGDQKAESSFRSLLQDNMSSDNNFQQETGQIQWRSSEKNIFSGDSSDHNEFKPVINLGFSFNQPQLSTTPQYSTGDNTTAITCQGLNSSFNMDSAANLYGSSSNILQGLSGSADNHHTQPPQQSMNFGKSSNNNFVMNSNDQFLHANWSKIPQSLRTSPPKEFQPSHCNLHFSNNTPYWNASDQVITKDIKPSFLIPAMRTQFPTQSFTEKQKPNLSEVRDPSTVVKKSGSDGSSKRPRNEAPPSLPPFKVRKEKMADRVTALQQLVSPFGKTDTASVLSEAIEYIKFLHEQVAVLSNPYMKFGASVQHQQNYEKAKEAGEGPKQDLRSRGLCLVPVSSTYPVTHESTVDFWTPAFGANFR